MSGSNPDGGYVPNAAFTREDWDEVSDNPEWTEDDFRHARPFAEVFPEIAQKLEVARALRTAPSRQLVSLTLDRDVVERFKSSGPDWKARINEVLQRAARDLP